MKRSLAFVIFLLFTSIAHADEILLSEVSASYSFTYPVSPLQGIYYSWYPPYTISFLAGDDWVGIPQRREIGPDDLLNEYYHKFDLTGDDGLAGYGHGWTIYGFQEMGVASVPADGLFTEFSNSFMTVHALYHPPNGTSFVGTNMRFTSMELTEGPIIVTDPFLDQYKSSFVVQFYGVPEPSCFVLLCFAVVHCFMARTLNFQDVFGHHRR